MAVFDYKGLDVNSKAVSGVIDAESEKAARSKLRKQKIFPTKISLQGNNNFSLGKKSSKVTIVEIANTTRQMAVLLGASIPLIDTLAATQDQTENPIIRKALADIREKVSEGGRLGDAMQGYPNLFDNIYINMVKAGEASGSLEVVLRRLADYKEAQAELRAKIKSAMTYPVIMIIVAVGMVTFLFTSVIPKISKLFDKQKAALPLPTEIIINVSAFINNAWPLVIIGIVGCWFLYRSYSRTPKGRLKIDDYKLRAPVFGELNRKVAVARLSRTLATLLSSGVQLLPGLEIVRNVMDNVVLSDVIGETMASVKEGESLAEPLKRSGRFPTLFIHMITVGEKTGMLEPMLEKVADTFDGEVEHSIEGMTALITPIMLVFMGGVIALIVMAVVMPILEFANMQ